MYELRLRTPQRCAFMTGHSIVALPLTLIIRRLICRLLPFPPCVSSKGITKLQKHAENPHVKLLKTSILSRFFVDVAFTRAPHPL
jgi:hypothetical protein